MSVTVRKKEEAVLQQEKPEEKLKPFNELERREINLQTYRAVD